MHSHCHSAERGRQTFVGSSERMQMRFWFVKSIQNSERCPLNKLLITGETANNNDPWRIRKLCTQSNGVLGCLYSAAARSHTGGAVRAGKAAHTQKHSKFFSTEE